MEEYSDCCGASRHHIYDELCGDCLEHCEFTDWDGEDEDDADYPCDIVNEF
jgi:hypothetical protein